MSIGKNLKELETDELKFITENFDIKENQNDKNFYENIEAAYLENIQRLYSFLPVKTYEFLKEFFIGDKITFSGHDSYNCVYTFEKFGLCSFEDEIHIFNDNDKNKNYFPDLNFHINKKLFEFLDKNFELVLDEYKLRDTISGILHTYLVLPFDDLLKIINDLGFYQNEQTLQHFLKYKVNPFAYYEKTNSMGQKIIVEGSNYILSETLDKIGNYKGNRTIHTLETYLNLAFHFNKPKEFLDLDDHLIKNDSSYTTNIFLFSDIEESLINDLDYTECLKRIENQFNLLDSENPIIIDSTVKEKIASLYNRFPVASLGGAINPNRVSL
ncbi:MULTISPECIES: hypothetical protein [Cetobacterium]|uniref:Uncharacterized protein n=1 Tax=Candidatus Cetobacterium colombiensis TaxID=3073100 RepID=A0ABU4WEP9_9FUSO|nr:hypothetical protein [Candidatus Cetobacterium colombiensis]MDX8337477.1 hypothetical protein [Candidatus Cetobacterium colombiensis]